MGKWCLHASSFIFDQIVIKVAGNQERHKSSDEFDFGPLVSMAHLYVFEMRFDLGTLDSGERSLPFGLLVFFLCADPAIFSSSDLYKNSDPKGLSAPVPVLYTCIKTWRIMYKIGLQRYFLQLATNGGARWLSGRVSDSGAPPCCVLEQDTLLPESTG